MQLFSLRYDTKFILWTLFIIQILLIGVFWMLQGVTTSNNIETTIDGRYIIGGYSQPSSSSSSFNFLKSSSKNDANYIKNNNVVFRKNNDNKNKLSSELEQSESFYYYNSPFQQQQNLRKIEIESISEFTNDFIIFTNSDNGENLTCFRDGTVYNENNLSNYIQNQNQQQQQQQQQQIYKINKNIKKCECKNEWHGKDCGQPEIIWRALMTSKLPIKLTTIKSKLIPNKIIYMIIGNFINIELFEIQIMELINIIDFFIICRKNNYNKKINIENKKRLKLNFISNEYHKRFFIIDNNYNLSNCTPKLLYKEFKNNLAILDKTNNTTTLNLNDIFLFSYEDEILNSKSIKYLKYYDIKLSSSLSDNNNVINKDNNNNDKLSSTIIRFRLKYNVYGFFWQHPENTYLSSLAITIKQLEQQYKMDPKRILSINYNNQNSKKLKNQIIIGDLNHYGGWYCQFCYQPSEIIERLQIDSLSLSKKINNNNNNSLSITSIFPKNLKNHNQQIDTIYIQNLIASGLYVDGKLGLIKLNKFNDKYYLPYYVDKNYWKFNNIITNLYLSFNEYDDNYAR